MWHEIFAASTSAIRKKKKMFPKKTKIPQKFNMSLTSELSKEPLLASRLNICHILDIAIPLAIFRQLCQIRHFCQICHFRQNRHSLSPKSPLSKGPILASNLNRHHSGVFSHFFPFSPLHEILDVRMDLTSQRLNSNAKPKQTQILLLIIHWYVLHPVTCVLQNMTHYLLVTPHTKLNARGSQNKLNLPRTVMKTSLVTEFPTPLSVIHR